MNSIQVKIGRNERCPCGSGQKYKKCCLSLAEKSFQKKEHSNSLRVAHQKSEEALRKRVRENLGDNVTLWEGELEVKMSEIILHLAEDLLEAAQKTSQIKKAIAVTCVAWNLAEMFDALQREEELKKFLGNSYNSQAQKDICDVIDSIIEKKKIYYPSINRMILDHELIGSKNNFHLNVVSTVPKTALAQLI